MAGAGAARRARQLRQQRVNCVPVSPKTSDLYDRYGDEARVLPPILHDFGGRSSFGGRVVTVKCFEDNSRVKEILAQSGAGRVLVVDGGGSLRCALVGDLIAGEAVRNGWEGIVVWGCVRDRAVLRTLDVGIRALGATPRKSVRRNEGQIDVPVDIEGVRCSPGDVLFADEDGILLLDATHAEAAKR